MHQRRGDGGDPIGRLITAPDARRGRHGEGDLGAQRGFFIFFKFFFGGVGSRSSPPTPRAGVGAGGFARLAFCEAAGSSRQAGKLGYLLFYFLIFPPEATWGCVCVGGEGWFPIFILHFYLSLPPPNRRPPHRQLFENRKKGKKEKKKKN